ncbi:MAG: HK97 family phage prohead protease [Acidobacteriaceae bacterium]
MKRQFQFEVKSIASDGTFTGLASTYGNVDLGNDMVMPGAFTKTLSDKRGQVPLLMGHDTSSPIGLAVLTDTPSGLQVKGELVLEVPEAKSAYALLKKGVIKGLSIGYDTVKSVMDGGVRKLTELKLFEVSLTPFPMNESAVITSVKAEGDQIAQFRRVLAECRKSFGR